MEWVLQMIQERSHWIERLKMCYLQKSFLEGSYCAIMVLLTTNEPKDKMYYNELLEKCINKVNIETTDLEVMLYRWNVNNQINSKYKSSQSEFVSSVKTILQTTKNSETSVLQPDLASQHSDFFQLLYKMTHFPIFFATFLLRLSRNPWENLIVYSTVANILRARLEQNFKDVIQMNTLILNQTKQFFPSQVNQLPSTEFSAIETAVYNFYALSCNEIGFLHDVHGADLDAAKPFYEESVKYDSKNAVHIFNRAIMYSKTNQYAKALQDFHTTIQLDSSFRLAYLDLGLLYRDRLNDFKQALLLFISNYQENLQAITKHRILESTYQNNLEQRALHPDLVFDVAPYWYRVLEMIAGIFRSWDEHYIAAQFLTKAEQVSQRIFLKRGFAEIQDDNLDAAQHVLSQFS